MHPFSQNAMKKKRYVVLVLLSTLAIIFIYQWLPHVDNSRFSCNHPEFRKVKTGMTKAQITTLLGHPKTIRLKKGIGNFMAQGENNKIEEAWIYRFPLWNGGNEVYFDATGHVVGRNCGHG